MFRNQCDNFLYFDFKAIKLKCDCPSEAVITCSFVAFDGHFGNIKENTQRLGMEVDMSMEHS